MEASFCSFSFFFFLCVLKGKDIRYITHRLEVSSFFCVGRKEPSLIFDFIFEKGEEGEGSRSRERAVRMAASRGDAETCFKKQGQSKGREKGG